jgi:hypothetical protein
MSKFDHKAVIAGIEKLLLAYELDEANELIALAAITSTSINVQRSLERLGKCQETIEKLAAQRQTLMERYK